MNENSISEEQAARMTAEFRELADKAQKQLDEHKAWLKDRIWTLMVGEMSLVMLNLLMYQVDHIRLETVRAEPNVTQLVKEGEHTVAKPTISVIYEYPDELFAFLTNDATPAELRASMVSANVDKLGDQPALQVKRLADTPGAKKL